MMRRRITRAAAAMLLTITAPLAAAPPQAAAGLLPTDIARPLLERDPGVRAARAGVSAGEAEARSLAASPYDLTAKLSGQRRDVEGAGDYREWNAGIERTIRLPGKAAADRQLGETAVASAQAALGEALHEAARELVQLWVDWLAAERAQELASASLQSSERSLAAVERRTRSGDASKLELGTAKAEWMEQRRRDNDAKTAAQLAWNRLSQHFPGIPRQLSALPEPLAIEPDITAWQQRILEQSDELRLAQLEHRKAQQSAERERAERIADPTLGAYTASEVGGRERFSGIAITIPIGFAGNRRSASAQRAAALADSAGYAAQQKQREFEIEIAAAFIEARGAYDSYLIASEGAASGVESARLMERAYRLGEAGLQDLLLAQRQASAAAHEALLAQAAALKAYYTLVVDAHWVWDLEHD